jgi:hypothetical protein
MTKDERKKSLKEELVNELMNGIEPHIRENDLRSLGIYLECTGDMEIVKTWNTVPNFKSHALFTIRQYMTTRFSLERLIGMHLQMTGKDLFLKKYSEIVGE